MVTNCGWGADKSDWQIGQACHKIGQQTVVPGIMLTLGWACVLESERRHLLSFFVSKIALLVDLAMLLYASNSVYLMH